MRSETSPEATSGSDHAGDPHDFGQPVEAQQGLLLSRGDVLRSALGYIDEFGLVEFNAANLADNSGLTTAAIKSMFPVPDDLLDAIAGTFFDELASDSRLSHCHWQEYLQRLAHGIRRAALAHPQAFPILATRPAQAPRLHPPLRPLQWVESFLDTLKRAGFSDRTAASAYRAFFSFLLGHLLLEVAADNNDLESKPSASPFSDTINYPRVTAVQQNLTADHASDRFEEVLENLLDHLETQGLR